MFIFQMAPEHGFIPSKKRRLTAVKIPDLLYKPWKFTADRRDPETEFQKPEKEKKDGHAG